MLTFLNANSGAFSLLFSLVVAVATVFYAILTRKLVSETERMRQAQTEPNVSVRIEQHPEFFNIAMLTVENVGAGPAYDVRLSVEPAGYEFGTKRKLSDVGLFKHGVQHLAVRQSIRTFVANLIDFGKALEDGDRSRNFVVTASFKDALGKKHTAAYPIDFLQFVGLMGIGEPAIRSIADSLKKLEDSIGRIGRGWSSLKVDATIADRVPTEKDEAAG